MSAPIELWQIAALIFFAYIMLVVALRGPRGRSAGLVYAGAASGIIVVAAASIDGQTRVLREWIWPPLVLLIAYWSSGFLYTAPIGRQERALAWLDERSNVRNAARRTPRVVAELLEAAYVGIYPLIPIALALHLTYSGQPDPARFWSVILITDFVCFGILPWVQTRPPRALERQDPWPSSLRAFNLQLLGATSIQVNTFPSGHAAEALAAALLILGAPAPVVALMFAAALAVAAGAVLGRYHYLADVLVGWVVALAVVAVIGR